MKPKRVILLIDPDEVWLSVTAVMLTTWGYIVARRQKVELCDIPIDLIVVREQRIGEQINARAIFTCPVLQLPAEREYTTHTLRERIRIMLVRKRGPKPARLKESEKMLA